LCWSERTECVAASPSSNNVFSTVAPWIAHKRAHLKFLLHPSYGKDLMSNYGILVRIKETENSCNTKLGAKNQLDLMGKVRIQIRKPVGPESVIRTNPTRDKQIDVNRIN
jgi:hypothetical protein